MNDQQKAFLAAALFAALLITAARVHGAALPAGRPQVGGATPRAFKRSPTWAVHRADGVGTNHGLPATAGVILPKSAGNAMAAARFQ